jgi:hypothetical protein
VRVTKLPEYIDIGTCSLGSDDNLDVLARGYHSIANDPPAPVLDGYAAGRAKMIGGVAVLQLPAWQTSGMPVPLTLDGVTPYVDWTFYADGVGFGGEPLGTSPFAYANLAVDTTVVQASLVASGRAQITHRYIAGVPSAIALSATDFLPAFDASTTITSAAPFALGWDAATATDVDAVHLHATWQGGRLTTNVVPTAHRVIWDAVVPSDVTEVRLPALDDDLGATLAGTDGIVPVDIVLRHLDSSELADFAAVQRAGLHAEDTVQISPMIAAPAAGQVRTSHVIGLR